MLCSQIQIQTCEFQKQIQVAQTLLVKFRSENSSWKIQIEHQSYVIGQNIQAL